jgi:hypothetical protein
MSKSAFWFGFGVMIASTALKVLLGYDLAFIGLFTGLSMMAYAFVIRNEKAEDPNFTVLPRIAIETLEMRDSNPRVIIEFSTSTQWPNNRMALINQGQNGALDVHIDGLKLPTGDVRFQEIPLLNRDTPTQILVVGTGLHADGTSMTSYDIRDAFDTTRANDSVAPITVPIHITYRDHNDHRFYTDAIIGYNPVSRAIAVRNFSFKRVK